MPVMRFVFGLAAVTGAALAQTISPVWVQHLNGLVNVDPANKLPILVRAGGTGDNTYNANGTDVVDIYTGFLKYDDNLYLLGIRENGINEGDPGLSQELRDRAAAYPDRSIIWIDAQTGKALGVALKTEVLPVSLNTQSPTHFWWSWGISEGAHGERVIYTGYKYKILRYASTGLVDDPNFPNRRATWSATPTVAWTEPVPDEPDPSIPPYVDPLDPTQLAAWLDSSGGDGSASWRLKAFRVSGSGNNLRVFAGGATWRASMAEQEFVTEDGGMTLYPVARLNDRGDGNGAKGFYTLGGEPSSIRTDPDGYKWCIQGHYPGSGWGARPGRYVLNPNGVDPCTTNDPPVAWWNCTTRDTSTALPTRKYYYDPINAAVGSPDLPAFSWEAAGLGDWVIDNKVDGVEHYDGNWVMTADTKDGVDYIVTYAIPSWNQQFGGVGPDWPNSVDPNSTFKPGWVGLHTLDGKISKGTGDGTGNAYKIPVYETDEPILDPNGNGGTGHDSGYDGDVAVYPIVDGKGSSLVLWCGGCYGFGVFRVDNVPAAITQQPLSLTKYEGESATFSATVTGGANRYQWLKNGQPLKAATSTSYNIERLVLGDAGTYKLRVLNGQGNVESADAVLTVLVDDVPPAVVALSGGTTPGKSAYWLTVTFSERVTAESAGTASNYSISGGVAVTSVVVQSATQVLLKTGAMGTGDYVLTLSNIKDQSVAGNVMAPGTQVKFKGPTLRPGFVLWEIYPGISGTAVTDLQADVNYPDNPAQREILDAMGTPSNVGDDFGARLTAYLTPTEGGNYTFFLRSDDASLLTFSIDNNPLTATWLAEETSCCQPFLEPNPDNPPLQTSAPQALQAGVTRFIMAEYKEGGGGDYCQVAWRKEGDPTPAAELTPIPGAYLSSWVITMEEPPVLSIPAVAAGNLTLTWTGGGTLQESSDLKSWSDVPGSPTSPYTTALPTGAGQNFYRVMR